MPVDSREPNRSAGRVAALAVCCVLSAGCSTSADSSDPSPAPTEVPTPAHLPEAQVRRLQDDMTSGVPARVRRAIELPAHQSLDPTFVDQLDRLTIVIDLDTAVVSGEEQVGATATVTRADGTDEQWQVTLDRLHGTYKIADTQQADR